LTTFAGKAFRRGVSLACSEEIRAQHYDVGQEFKPHTDCFQPGTTEWNEHARERGQARWVLER